MSSGPASSDALAFDTSFRDFKFLQGHMARRLYAQNRGAYGRSLLGVVACASFIALAIVINIHPFLAMRLIPLPYPFSIYVALIIVLIAAIFSLIPAIALRFSMLRMQVSDDGPALGPTTITLEDDGLVVERKHVRTQYGWGAFRSVEIVKGAVILALDNGLGLIVPASAFASDAARFDFAAAVSGKLADKAAAR